jgi:hypothetical protein
MSRYRLHRDLNGLGKSGDIIHLDSIDNIPFNSTLELLETEEIEMILDDLEKEPAMDSERISEIIDSQYIITDKEIYRK